MRELPIPPDALGDEESVELARIWVGAGDLHLTLSLGGYGAPDGPGETTAWGDILADTLRHVARGIAQHDGRDEVECLEELLARMAESLGGEGRPAEGGFEG